MFTGIVQAVGSVRRLGEGKLQVSYPVQSDFQEIAPGESICVSGVCLTSLDRGPNQVLEFDLSGETLARSSLGALTMGDPVNMERAMTANGRFGGHIVQGHVDAVGHIAAIRREGNSVVYTFRCDPASDRYLIDKGSICIDGISFTMVEPAGGNFDVWVIPHTLEVTNLGSKHEGDPVNLEFDVIAKHVEKLMSVQPARVSPDSSCG